jgi:hypothetical protein
MSLCPHGVRIEHRRCDRCEEIAEAEMRVQERGVASPSGILSFAHASDKASDDRRAKALTLLERAKGYAHCNCPPDESTGRVSYHSNCQKGLMPILEELEGLLTLL